jgi:hypothetical protein
LYQHFAPVQFVAQKWYLKLNYELNICISRYLQNLAPIKSFIFLLIFVTQYPDPKKIILISPDPDPQHGQKLIVTVSFQTKQAKSIKQPFRIQIF